MSGFPVVWINGAFGSGKSTVASALVDLMDGARLFDPELVGFVIRRLPGGRGYQDFQDDPRWRPLVAATVLALGRYYRAPIIAPMTVTNRPYFDEIVEGLRAGGARVHLFRLVVDPDVLQRRIEQHTLFPDDPQRSDDVRRWRLDHLTAGVEALANPAFGEGIDNGARSPAVVAADIQDRVETATDSRSHPRRPKLPTAAQAGLILGLAVRHRMTSRPGRE